MDAQRADRIADQITKECVFMFRTAHCGALWGIGGCENQAAVHRQCKASREKQRDGQHVGRVVVEVQILIADV